MSIYKYTKINSKYSRNNYKRIKAKTPQEIGAFNLKQTLLYYFIPPKSRLSLLWINSIVISSALPASALVNLTPGEIASINFNN